MTHSVAAPRETAGGSCRFRLCAGQLVSLGGHDEVIFVETVDFLGVPGDLGAAPSEGDFRMVALDLRQAADLGNKVHCFLEVLETEAALNTAPVVHKRPTGRLLQITFSLSPRERRNPAAARRTSLGRKIVAHSWRTSKRVVNIARHVTTCKSSSESHIIRETRVRFD